MSAVAIIASRVADRPVRYPVLRRVVRGSRFDPPRTIPARQMAALKVLSAAAVTGARLGRYDPLGVGQVVERPFRVALGPRRGWARMRDAGYDEVRVEVVVEVVVGGRLMGTSTFGQAYLYRSRCDAYFSSWIERRAGLWLQMTGGSASGTYIRQGVGEELAALDIAPLPLGPLM